MNAAASPTITVALLDPSGGQQSASVIASDRSLKLIGIASDPTALVDEVAKEPPSVVLVDTRALPADALLDLTARLSDSTAIIVAGDAADGALLSHAIRFNMPAPAHRNINSVETDFGGGLRKILSCEELKMLGKDRNLQLRFGVLLVGGMGQARLAKQRGSGGKYGAARNV